MRMCVCVCARGMGGAGFVEHVDSSLSTGVCAAHACRPLGRHTTNVPELLLDSPQGYAYVVYVCVCMCVCVLDAPMHD